VFSPKPFGQFLGPTQLTFILVAQFFTGGGERQGREIDHSPPSSAGVKNEWSYNSAPSVHHLVDRDNITCNT